MSTKTSHWRSASRRKAQLDADAKRAKPMLVCDLCQCLIVHEERAIKGSWYAVCEFCIADNNDRAVR